MAKIKTPLIQKPFIRITPEEILESFLITKFIPLNGHYEFIKLTKKGIEADGLTAFYVKGALDAKRIMEDIMFNLKTIPIGAELENYGGYDTDYIAGFTRGWDGGDLPYTTEAFSKGHEDGKNSWRLASKK